MIYWVMHWCHHWWNSISNMSSFNTSFNSPFNWGSSLIYYSLLKLCTRYICVRSWSSFNHMVSHWGSADVLRVFNIVLWVWDRMIIMLHHLSNSVSTVELKSHRLIRCSKCIQFNWKCFILLRNDHDVIVQSIHFSLKIWIIIKWWSIDISCGVDAIA